MSIDYSAMESVINNINGIAISPISYTMECETGCYRAIPDSDDFVNKLLHYIDRDDLQMIGLDMSKKAKESYDWDKTANMWIEHFKTIPLKNLNETWQSQPNIRIPAEDIPSNIVDLADQVSYLFNRVLYKPEWIGGYLWSKTIKDCTFGYRVHNSEEDYYFHESHLPNVEKYQKFNYADAAKDFTGLRNQWNEWEKLRGEINGKL